MKKRLALFTVIMFGLAVLLASCAGVQKPTASNFQDPKITLESFMVPQYDGYYYYAADIKPTKGEAGAHGAPLPMSFLFNIENPNPYPILLEDFKFTVAFDKDFDLVTVNNQDAYWIPAGKTDQIRANTLITVQSAYLSLLVTGGFTLKEKGWSPWDALERWWKDVPDMAVPVSIKDASFNFSADGLIKVIPFKADTM